MMQLRWIGAIIIVLVLLTSAVCIGGIVLIGVTQADTPTGDHIAVVDIHGQITTRDPGGLFAVNGASAERIIRELEEIRDTDSVKGLMLDIDSPGGAVIASGQIYTELLRVQAEGIPIVAYFGNTATSAAYHISTPADVIVANPGTVTGSIGVISQVPNLEALYEKIGIEMQTITTGEFKDMMQPARPLTEEERQIIRDIQEEIGMIDDAGWEVGLHGGHQAYCDDNQLAIEKDRLEKVLGRSVTGYRNHYLRFRVPETWRHLAQAGFSYDTTFGYADCVGFRNGMCYPFRPFDLEKDEEIPIVEIPLTVMDNTLDGYMRLDPRKAWEITRQLIDTVEQHRGVFTLLWHNTYMDGERLKFYEKVLSYCHDKGAWMTSGEEIASVSQER